MYAEPHFVTADDLFRMPDDGYSYELVQGRLIRMSKPSPRHGLIGMRLGAALYRFVEERGLGATSAHEAGFKLATNPDTVRGPDVWFVRRERIPLGGLPDSYWLGAPDLAVEVRSPSDTRAELMEKAAEYLRCGARLVWVIDPKQQSVTVSRPEATPAILTSGDELDGGDVVPGFRFRVSRLFE